MQRFFNIAFPLDDPVLAPLYTHVDTRGSGTVYYGETDSPEILSRAGGMVRSSFKDAIDFMPTHVFLTTWVDVGYYNEKSDKVSGGQVGKLVQENPPSSFWHFAQSFRFLPYSLSVFSLVCPIVFIFFYFLVFHKPLGRLSLCDLWTP